MLKLLEMIDPGSQPQAESVGFPVHVPLEGLVDTLDGLDGSQFVDVATDFAQESLNDWGLDHVQIASVEFEHVNDSRLHKADAVFNVILSGITQEELDSAMDAHDDWG